MAVNAIAVIDSLMDRMATLGAENERLKAENAALLNDLREADYMGCKHCLSYEKKGKSCQTDCVDCTTPCVCNECYHNNLWKWRGIQK